MLAVPWRSLGLSRLVAIAAGVMRWLAQGFPVGGDNAEGSGCISGDIDGLLGLAESGFEPPHDGTAMVGVARIADDRHEGGVSGGRVVVVLDEAGTEFVGLARLATGAHPLPSVLFGRLSHRQTFHHLPPRLTPDVFCNHSP